MKNLFLILVFFISYNSFAQTKHYKSSNYKYSIDIPISFIKSTPRSIYNDLIFIEKTASIIMIVYKHDLKIKTPHDLTKEFFYNIDVKNDPNVKIFDDQKIIVNGIKAYKYVTTMKYAGTPDKLNQVCFVYFYGDMEYILTMTCATKYYDKYKAKYDAVGKSVKFY